MPAAGTNFATAVLFGRDRPLLCLAAHGRFTGRTAMRDRSSIGAIALLAALGATFADAAAWDDAQYPNWKGQWLRYVDPSHPPTEFDRNPIRFDASKPWARGQEPPLTPEYQAIFEANLEAQARGGQGTTPTYTCRSPGMPRVMNGYGQMEFIVTPDTTYFLVQHVHDDRRIFTDGRDWPAEVEPTYLGYSIGKWVDTDGDGRYDTLDVETRHFRGPRSFDSGGIPLHKDNQTVVKERIYLEKTNPNMLRNQITVIDNALTRPWTVVQAYRRNPNPRPYWREVSCPENNAHIEFGNQNYMRSADGLLMPTHKDQPPPDLRYFNQSQR
jgi:hypothetical protein